MNVPLVKILLKTLANARASAFAVVYLILATFTVLGADQPATTLRGTCECSVYQGRPAPLYSSTNNFQASVAGQFWIISYESTADSGNADSLNTKTVASCDGTNIFVVIFQDARADRKAWGDRYESVKNELPVALATIYPGNYPPLEDASLQNIWLGFASSPVLADSRGKAKPPFYTDLETFCSTNYYCDYYWTTNETPPDGKQLILKDNGHSLALLIKGQKTYVKLAAPYDQGYMNGMGVWRQSREIAGAFWPTEFEFTTFAPKSMGRTAEELVTCSTSRCHVTNMFSAPMPPVPTPLPVGKVVVTDRRFDKRTEGGTHYVTTKGWFHQEIDPAELAASQTIKLTVGDSAPDFIIRTFDGKSRRLSDLRGKYVLLDFWATTCAPCIAGIPDLKTTFDAFGKNERFALISLSLDVTEKEPRKFVAARGIPWLQSFLDDDLKATVQRDYGFNAIPQVLLVGPDGKLLAKDLRGPKIREAVAAALER